MEKISKADFKKAIEVVKSYNQQRIYQVQFKDRKICNSCGNMVKSAVAGHCQNCWETGDFRNEP